MKIAIISDLHGNITATKEVLEDIKSKKVDKIYCTGDLVGYAPFPNEIIELIRNNNIKTVQGNHDEKVGRSNNDIIKDLDGLSDNKKAMNWTKQNVTMENKEWLKNLPSEIMLTIDGYNILFVHGSPSSNSEYIYEHSDNQMEISSKLKENILIFGHSHIPFYKKVNNKLLINAGSVGKPKHGDSRSSYVTVDFLEEEILVNIVYLEYDVEKIFDHILKSPIPNSLAEKLKSGTN